MKHWRNLLQRIFAFLVLIVFALPTYSQNRTVSGKITDKDDDSGIPGVNILVQGTTNGTVTDIDGNYELSVPSSESVLVISFVGYKSQQVALAGRSKIDVSLETDVAFLSEVVVVGYGAVEKKDVTGSIASVNEKDFNMGVITSPERLLAGKVAGVQITSNGGEPGGASFIRIRGATSLSADPDPLIVIDGVPMSTEKVSGSRNPLNFVNPADIANITVLKDASATAIYGARGANGVIIITTKEGTAGKIKVSYDGFYSVSTFTKGAGELSPSNFRAAINLKAPQEIINLGEANTVWVDEVTQSAIALRQMLSVSGGTENHRIRASVGFLKNEGVLKTSSNENINVSLKYNGEFFNDNLKVNINTKFGKTKNRFADNVIGTALTYDPTRPVRDGNPETAGYFQWTDALVARNPVATLELKDNTGETDRFLGNIELEYNIPFVSGLSVKTNLSTDVGNGENQNFQPRELSTYTSAAADSGSYGNYVDRITSKLFEIYGTYKKDISSINGKFDITAGFSWQDFIKDQTTAIDVYRLGENFDRNNPLVGTIARDTRPPFIENRLSSFFGRANFHLKDKYLVTVNIRRDGSTKFAPSNQWGFFPSVAFGWRVLDENFAEPLTNVFSDLKLRFGYGVVGNQGIEDYLYSPLYRYSLDDARYQFGNSFVSTLRPNSVDPTIKWEETKTSNFGLDFALGKGKVYGSIDVYRKFTTDLLADVAFPVGSLTGDRAVTNVGEMENKGIELLLNSTIIDKDDFSLSTSFNIAYNKNTILKLDNAVIPDSVFFAGYEVGSIAGDVGQNIQILRVGESINTFRTYSHKYGADGFPIFSTSNIDMYEDINQDGIINEEDRVINRSPDPKIMMGFTANATYKNFDLGLTFRSQLGNYVYNNVSSATGFFQNLDDRVTQNIHESAFDTNFGTKQLFSDYYIEDASFVKLDNITLGFNKNLKSLNVRVYTTFQNVFTLTGYSGIDPEVSSGIDNNVYPRSLTAIIGVNLTY